MPILTIQTKIPRNCEQSIHVLTSSLANFFDSIEIWNSWCSGRFLSLLHPFFLINQTLNVDVDECRQEAKRKRARYPGKDARPFFLALKAWFENAFFSFPRKNEWIFRLYVLVDLKETSSLGFTCVNPIYVLGAFLFKCAFWPFSAICEALFAEQRVNVSSFLICSNITFVICLSEVSTLLAVRCPESQVRWGAKLRIRTSSWPYQLPFSVKKEGIRTPRKDLNLKSNIQKSCVNPVFLLASQGRSHSFKWIKKCGYVLEVLLKRRSTLVFDLSYLIK